MNSIFGPELFALPGGRVRYDSVYMVDGGRAIYLARLHSDLSAVFRWIPWETEVIQFYDPMEVSCGRVEGNETEAAQA